MTRIHVFDRLRVKPGGIYVHALVERESRGSTIECTGSVLTGELRDVETKVE